MDGNSFVAQLREIRSNLRDALRAANALENKFVGPRPEDPKVGKEAMETVSTFLADIDGLALQLSKTLSHHHAIVGDFQPAVNAG